MKLFITASGTGSSRKKWLDPPSWSRSCLILFGFRTSPKGGSRSTTLIKGSTFIKGNKIFWNNNKIYLENNFTVTGTGTQ